MSCTASAGPSAATAKPTAPTRPPATAPRRPRWAWDVVLALGVLAFVPTMAAAIPLWAYFWGLGYAGAGQDIILASMAAVVVSFVGLVVRLVAFWRRWGWLGRILRFLPVALVVLVLVPSSPIGVRRLRPSIEALLPDDLAAYLYGFRDRMRVTADWEAIRQWAKEARESRPKDDSSPLELPPCIQRLDPWQVTLARDGVVLRWHVGWAFINPPTCAALIVFADDSTDLQRHPDADSMALGASYTTPVSSQVGARPLLDAHRIAPGVWVAYWPAFDEE